ncbi:uncharacterized protein LOC101242827 [Ciona intestinalis]
MDPRVEVGVTLTDQFVSCLPEYFETNAENKIHHDMKQEITDLNVFSETKRFADAYKGEVLVENISEFYSIRDKLLTLPTFVEVYLNKSKSSGNTTYITKGKFIVYLNTTHPAIQQQLREILGQAEVLINEGKHFALEICLDDMLKYWYKANFPDSGGFSFEAEGANICVTNFSRRFHECYNPLLWLGCLPVMLLCGTPYCIYRAVKCIDVEQKLRGSVVYIEGVNQHERDTFNQILRQAYMDGLNSTIQQPPPYTMTSQPSIQQQL